jgi:hypothetical protein
MHSKWDDRYTKPTANPDGSYPYEVAAFQFRYGLLAAKNPAILNRFVPDAWLYSSEQQFSVKAPIINASNNDRWGDSRRLNPPPGFLVERDASTEVEDFDEANPHKFRDHAVQYTSRNLMGNGESEWLISPKPGLVFSVKIESRLPIKEGFSFDDSSNASMSDFSIYEPTGRFFKFRCRQMVNGLDFTQSPTITKQIDTYSFDHKSTEEIIAYDWFFSHNTDNRPYILSNPKIIDISDDGKRCLLGFYIPFEVQHIFSFFIPDQITETLNGYIGQFRLDNRFGLFAVPNSPISYPVAFVEVESNWDDETEDLTFSITRVFSRKNVGQQRRNNNDLGTSSMPVNFEFYKLEEPSEETFRCVNRTVWLCYKDNSYDLKAYRFNLSTTNGSTAIFNTSYHHRDYIYDGFGGYSVGPESQIYDFTYTSDDSDPPNKTLTINGVAFDASTVNGNEDGRAYQEAYFRAPDVIIPHARIFIIGATKYRGLVFTFNPNEEDYFWRQVQIDGLVAKNSNGDDIVHNYIAKPGEPTLGYNPPGGTLSNQTQVADPVFPVLCNNTYCTRDPDTGQYILFADRPVVFT